MTKGKRTKAQATIYKALKIEQLEPPLKTGGEIRCSGRVNSSCPVFGTQIEG
jgi:hypothetical protein